MMGASASGKLWVRVFVVGVVLVLLVIPQVAGRFWQYLTLNILLLSLFSLSFNLLFGMTGLLSSDMPPSMRPAPTRRRCCFARGWFLSCRR